MISAGFGLVTSFPQEFDQLPGDVLADGVKVAAERLGKGTEQYAVHIGGQELGMHDPKFTSPALRGMFSISAKV